MATDEPPSTSMALSLQSQVEAVRRQQVREAKTCRDRLPVAAVAVASTGCAWPVTGGKCDSIVEEEQRCPPARTSERPTPAPELGLADEPQLAAVVTNHVLSVIDDATAVPGEHASGRVCVEITPRIDTVAAGLTPVGQADRCLLSNSPGHVGHRGNLLAKRDREAKECGPIMLSSEAMETNP